MVLERWLKGRAERARNDEKGAKNGNGVTIGVTDRGYIFGK